MTEHRQTIESAWDNLLEALAEAQQDAATQTPTLPELAARRDTLHASLRGLGNAWTAIRDLFPAEQANAADEPDEPGALPESAYWKPLACALLSLGGEALARDAVAKVGLLLEKKLHPIDRQPLPTGQIRWNNRTYFARERLKKHGLLRRHSERGLWKLTEAGKRWAESDMLRLPQPVPEPDHRQGTLPF